MKIVLVLLLSFNILGRLAGENTSQKLFIIERSKNKNIVSYDVNLDEKNELNVKYPVSAYWLLYEKDGRKKELTWLDKKAYGFKCDFDKKDKYYRLKLIPYKDREIKIYKMKELFKAEIIIDGKPAFLERIFINSKETMTGPQVLYIELFGIDIRTSEKLYEKIFPEQQ